MTVTLITDSADDYESDDHDESDDTGSDGYKSISSYGDYDDELYGFKSKKKKKKVYLPVFVPDTEKKKSKIKFISISIFFICYVLHVLKCEIRSEDREVKMIWWYKTVQVTEKVCFNIITYNLHHL